MSVFLCLIYNENINSSVCFRSFYIYICELCFSYQPNFYKRATVLAGVFDIFYSFISKQNQYSIKELALVKIQHHLCQNLQALNEGITSKGASVRWLVARGQLGLLCGLDVRDTLAQPSLILCGIEVLLSLRGTGQSLLFMLYCSPVYNVPYV